MSEDRNTNRGMSADDGWSPGERWATYRRGGLLRSPKGVGKIDLWLADHSARMRPSDLDPILRAVTVSANHSRLWMAAGALLALTGGRRGRRAAARGLGSVLLTSAVANGVAKPLFPRRRPPADAVPVVRRLSRRPVSSSFPSGHAASAAAFATGVGVEFPAAGLAVAPLAAAVGYSRVHVGVHWPSDVLVGSLMGAAVGLATRRWWPVADDSPAVPPQEWPVAHVPDGKGMVLVVNPNSGSGSRLPETVRAKLSRAVVLEVDDGDLAARIHRAVHEEDAVALGVVGGDGTVSTVAEAAVGLGLPLAVFAGGTLNHFARDVGVEDPRCAFAALDSGVAVAVDTARVRCDGREQVFVNTASLGGYPDFVRMREQWESRIGKWPAAALALARVLRRAEPVHVTIDGTPEEVWLFFAGNGTYSPPDHLPITRTALTGGDLDVRYLRADVRWSRARLAWAAATGTLHTCPAYVRRRVRTLDVAVLAAPVSLALDGEVAAQATHFSFTGEPSALHVYRCDR
ncbi:bifunctional phosphatase PAP2/diacylglycerol kinase family protein [Nocardia jejuensis]|uniref:bifunctional phosphatase PAP2/diacylglycerol kinase family protein n=1 Tax=Nocardia jejuensis TaxID=328049 RepID=UPI000B1EDCD4|nr:phosphatase PAP2 family protein [Nocardia jejuensis]